MGTGTGNYSAVILDAGNSDTTDTIIHLCYSSRACDMINNTSDADISWGRSGFDGDCSSMIGGSWGCAHVNHADLNTNAKTKRNTFTSSNLALAA